MTGGDGGVDGLDKSQLVREQREHRGLGRAGGYEDDATPRGRPGHCDNM
jgi:hypothetical protein